MVVVWELGLAVGRPETGWMWACMARTNRKIRYFCLPRPIAARQSGIGTSHRGAPGPVLPRILSRLSARITRTLRLPMLLRHPLIPPQVQIAWQPLAPDAPGSAPSTTRGRVRLAGDGLFGELAERIPGAASTLRIERPEMQRPRLCKGGLDWPVSLSHSREVIAAALCHSPDRLLGLDVERLDRPVPERLHSRIFHRDEIGGGLPGRTPAIRIWTLKEAALKWLGTGLRAPMTGIRLEWIAPGRFEALFWNGMRVEIRSFPWNSHWISIASGPAGRPDGRTRESRNAPDATIANL